MSAASLIRFVVQKASPLGAAAIVAEIVQGWIVIYGELMDGKYGGIGATAVAVTFKDAWTVYRGASMSVSLSSEEVMKTIGVASTDHGYMDEKFSVHENSSEGYLGEIPFHQQSGPRSFRMAGMIYSDFYGHTVWELRAGWDGQNWKGFVTITDTYDFDLDVNRELYSEVLTAIGRLATGLNNAQVNVSGTCGVVFPNSITAYQLFSNFPVYAEL